MTYLSSTKNHGHHINQINHSADKRKIKQQSKQAISPLKKLSAFSILPLTTRLDPVNI